MFRRNFVFIGDTLELAKLMRNYVSIGDTQEFAKQMINYVSIAVSPAGGNIVSPKHTKGGISEANHKKLGINYHI